jgi:hypothetical protein
MILHYRYDRETNTLTWPSREARERHARTVIAHFQLDPALKNDRDPTEAEINAIPQEEVDRHIAAVDRFLRDGTGATVVYKDGPDTKTGTKANKDTDQSRATT